MNPFSSINTSAGAVAAIPLSERAKGKRREISSPDFEAIPLEKGYSEALEMDELGTKRKKIKIKMKVKMKIKLEMEILLKVERKGLKRKGMKRRLVLSFELIPRTGEI